MADSNLEDKDLSIMIDEISTTVKSLGSRYGDSPEMIAKLRHAIWQVEQDFDSAHKPDDVFDKLDAML
jgi:hypothetical protein